MVMKRQQTRDIVFSLSALDRSDASVSPSSNGAPKNGVLLGGGLK